MAIRQMKPVTAAQRGMTTADLEGLAKTRPLRSLRRIQKSKAGRNVQGRITSRHRGGGAKRFYRLVDFRHTAPKGVVEAIEYDPNRSARIARVKTSENEYYYVLAGMKTKVGQTIQSGESVPIEDGNRLKLKHIPAGAIVYNIELKPGGGGQLARSAGVGAQLLAKEGGSAQIRMPSGEVRLISVECMATLGTVSNEQHQNVKLGSAGRKRRMGRRPHVRGKVMNAADHPHGGGDGGSHGVGREPKTPWGQKTLGYKTRRNKSTAKLIVRSRHEARRKR